MIVTTTEEIVFDNLESHLPNIIELLSEIEKRDQETKGSIQTHLGTDVIDLRGYTVLNTTKHGVGKVEDLYVDPNTREPLYALLSLGNHTFGLGDRRVLIDFDDLVITDDHHVKVKGSVRNS